LRRLLPTLLSALLVAACGDRADRPFAFRGMAPGMSFESFRTAAASAGSDTIECRPFAVPALSVDRLCVSPDSIVSMVRVAGAVDPAGGSVPYIVVREAITSPGALDRLAREWGRPDTSIGTGRRWTRGQWMANADTAADILTVWLSDTSTEARVAVATARDLRIQSGADTLPYFNDEAAVIDSLRADSAGRPGPALTTMLSRRPAMIGCTESPAPPHLASVTGAVFIAYVVDTAGRVEPENVRVLQASHVGLVDPAIATIRSCILRPGERAGRPVRVVISQRVTFRPQ
jgi:hypothetical protein